MELWVSPARQLEKQSQASTGGDLPARNQNGLEGFNPGGGFVSLKVYDVLSKEVSTLVNEQLSPGKYKVEFDGSGFRSGVYFYRLTAGEFTDTKRMMLLK